MTLTEEYEGSAGVEEVDIGRRIDIDDETRGERGIRARARARGRRLVGGVRAMDVRSEMRDVVTGGLATSAACIAVMIAASALHSGSAWAGINALESGLPRIRRRPASGFDPRLAAIGIGTIVGSSMLLSLLHRPIARTRMGGSRIGIGLLASAGSYAADRLLMQRSFVPTLRRTLGPTGLLLTYGAIGLAAAFARRA